MKFLRLALVATAVSLVAASCNKVEHVSNKLEGEWKATNYQVDNSEWKTPSREMTVTFPSCDATELGETCDAMVTRTEAQAPYDAWAFTYSVTQDGREIRVNDLGAEWGRMDFTLDWSGGKKVTMSGTDSLGVQYYIALEKQ